MFDASGADAEAVVIKPDLAMWDEAHALGLECVVRVSAPEDIEQALRWLRSRGVPPDGLRGGRRRSARGRCSSCCTTCRPGSSRSPSCATRRRTRCPSSSDRGWTPFSCPARASASSSRPAARGLGRISATTRPASIHARGTSRRAVQRSLERDIDDLDSHARLPCVPTGPPQRARRPSGRAASRGSDRARSESHRAARGRAP